MPDYDGGKSGVTLLNRPCSPINQLLNQLLNLLAFIRRALLSYRFLGLPVGHIHCPPAMVSSQAYSTAGAIDDWPAMKLWNAEYISEKAGDRHITVALSPNGRADAVTLVAPRKDDPCLAEVVGQATGQTDPQQQRLLCARQGAGAGNQQSSCGATQCWGKASSGCASAGRACCASAEGAADASGAPAAAEGCCGGGECSTCPNQGSAGCCAGSGASQPAVDKW